MRIICGIATLALATSMAFGHPGIDEQIARLDGEIAARPDEAALYVQRGELHRIHRDPVKAETDYRRAKSLDPSLITADFCLGRLKLEAGEVGEAKRLLDRYLAQRPDDTEALVARGRALSELNEHLAAAGDFDRAIAHPRNGNPRPEHYLSRARALVAAGPEYLPAAIDGLDEGLERLGQPVTLQLYAIDLELERENWEGALRRVDGIAAHSVRKEPWLARKGSILEAAGRAGEARAAYAQALSSIDGLPAHRRRNRAVKRVEDEARAAIERLTPAEQTP